MSEVELNSFDSDEVGSNEDESDEVESDEVESDEVESDEVESDEADLDEADSDEADPSEVVLTALASTHLVSGDIAVRANEALAILKQPWSAPSLTKAQLRKQKDIRLARILWEGVLKDFRIQKEELFANDTGKDPNYDEDIGTSGGKDPYFSSFTLPPEILLMIYDLCIEDDKVERKSRKRDSNPIIEQHWARVSSSRSAPVYSNAQIRASKLRHKDPTPIQKERERTRQQTLNRVIDKKMKQLDGDPSFTPGAQEAFLNYKQEHTMYAQRCWHEEHEKDASEPSDSDEQKQLIKAEKLNKHDLAIVNVRGELCEDLPLLSLVSRKFFEETFYLFYNTPREGFWFQWKVRNLDFFPLFRFWRTFDQMIHLDPDMILVTFDEELEWKDEELHGKKFANVKRLIELHWLQGFPLWACLTGLHGSMNCKGPFGDWMYSVRQIVALYRVDHEDWKRMTIKALLQCDIAENSDVSKPDWKAEPDPNLVEAAIEMISKAIEYSLGYDGEHLLTSSDASDWGENPFKPFRYKRTQRKTVGAKERSIVGHTVTYRIFVDQALREILGENYGKWEELPETELIPDNVVL